MDENLSGRITIQRPMYEHHQMREDFYYERKSKKSCLGRCNAQDFKISRMFTSLIPFFGWITTYKLKTNLLSDLISGFTVAIMHIPQGMAYAMLGNVPAVTGMYMAVFPVLVYFFLGTSRHNSMGTFAVVCLMTGKAVVQYSDPIYFQETAGFSDISNNATIGYSPMQVATAVTFVTALIQIGMFLLRLGVVSALLSETLVSGFTTGAAVHVLISQIKDVLGLHIPKFKGNFSNIYTIQAIFNELGNVNYAAMVICGVTILISSLNNEILKPIISKKSPVPVPIELIAVVVGTLVSKFGNLNEIYHVKIVGDIPVGLPEPTLPEFSLLTSVALDALSIAIVSYTVTLSMAMIFAQKLDYEVDANQELLAMGAGNIVGSCFSCMPFCASLSRSLIQQVVGGKTQIASVVSCSILVIVLLWIGPFFEPLPRSVLAGIIIVALKGMLMQVTAVVQFWKLSKMDAIVWTSTFLAVIFINIDIGLLVGLIMSVVTIIFLGFRPKTCLLGAVPNTDLYLDINRYKKATELKGIKIFHYSGGINFATKGIFKSDLIQAVNINPQKEIIYRSKLTKYMEKIEVLEEKSPKLNSKLAKVQNKVNTNLRCLILDFSSVSYIDPSGVKMLYGVIESFVKLDIPVYIASCKEPVYEMINKCHVGFATNASIRMFPTIHDAVECSTDIFRPSLNSSIATIRIE